MNEQVLHDGHLPEQDPVRDRVRTEESGRQMVRVSSLSTVWSKNKRVYEEIRRVIVSRGRGRDEIESEATY